MSEARPDPFYNVFTTLDECCPGVVMTMSIENALLLAYQANGYRPLSCAQVQAVVAPLIAEGNPPQYQAAPAPPRIPKIMPGATPVLAPLPPAPAPPVPPATAVKGVTAGDGLLVNGMAGATITDTGIISLAAPVAVAFGGTGAVAAGGQALDNISGFAATGYVQRTGPAAYALGPLPPAVIAVTAAGGLAADGVAGGAIANTGTVTIAAGPPGAVLGFDATGAAAPSTALAAGHLVKGGGTVLPAASATWSEAANGSLTGNFNAATLPGAIISSGIQLGGVDTAQTGLTIDVFASNGSIFFRRADGTGAAPAALAATTVMGAVQWRGWATGYTTARAQLSGVAAEAWTASAQGAALDFSTTPVGSTALGRAARIAAGLSVGPAILDNGAGTVTAQTDFYLGSRKVTPGTLQVAQSTPANPAGTASTAGVMMGVSGAITPQATSRVRAAVTGDVFTSGAAGNGASVQLRWGTGTAPANGAALAGTAAGGLVQYIAAAAGQKSPFALEAILTGLAPGTAYWVGLAAAALVGGTATVENLSIALAEL